LSKELEPPWKVSVNDIKTVDGQQLAADLSAALSIAAIYERALRSLLWRVQQPNLQRCVSRLMDEAQAKIEAGLTAADAFQQVYCQARSIVIERLVQAREALRAAVAADTATTPAVSPSNGRSQQHTRRLLEASVPETPLDAGPAGASPDFHCDAGLGGLARWLRAAGYDARFWPGIDDDELIAKTLNSCAIMLTTDRRLMQRGVIRWGAVPSLLVPMSVKKQQQLVFTVSQLDLPRKAARCMACGGSLRAVAKIAVRQRIPPRTYPWCDDYFECQRCGKLLWRGTHWERIEHLLNHLRDSN
jgi:uncharacterized protein with PIN domain